MPNTLKTLGVQLTLNRASFGCPKSVEHRLFDESGGKLNISEQSLKKINLKKLKILALSHGMTLLSTQGVIKAEHAIDFIVNDKSKIVHVYVRPLNRRYRYKTKNVFGYTMLASYENMTIKEHQESLKTAVKEITFM